MKIWAEFGKKQIEIGVKRGYLEQVAENRIFPHLTGFSHT